MATLILTTVGGAVGGPIGAALGGLLGGALDAKVFGAAKGREGPRLTELSVQTSSYGTPIARLYGTLRVAGTVIWATDLQETRSSTGGGKGKPGTTTYTYSASFAVLLSGRRVQSVGRIWADGKLLRGAAGDFKSQTGYRLHLGGEEQAPDPLIASAEDGVAPAHRGAAYAVFENFQLADYGNRIPSLTFEVVADAGPVAVSDIARDVGAGRVAAAGGAELGGFSAYGDSMRGVLTTLASAGGGWFASDGAAIRMAFDGAPDGEVADAGFGATPGSGLRGARTIAAIDAAPRALSIAYYDPARDYQAGLQRARRPGAGVREERIEMPAALGADAAKAMAEAALARAEAGRERRRIALPVASLGIAPGDRVTIAGESGRWRVAGWTLEHMVLGLELVRIARAPLAAAASPGRVLAAPDRVQGPTTVVVFELPPLDDTLQSAPRVGIAAAGAAPGWRQAALLYSLDEGVRWSGAGAASVAATMGVVVTPPGAGQSRIRDDASWLSVDLLHDGMTLHDADADALAAGANLALAGGELLQFGRATQLAGRRWRLDRLLRGRRGTEAAAGLQASGDAFVLLERDAVVTLDLPPGALGATVRVLASGVGDVDGPAEAACAVRGASLRPPAPVALRWVGAGAGDAVVSWVRRSRAGWRWTDGGDAPLGEERESYRVTVAPAAGPAREVVTDTPAATVLAAERSGPVAVSVRQAGTHAESLAATIVVAAL